MGSACDYDGRDRNAYGNFMGNILERCHRKSKIKRDLRGVEVTGSGSRPKRRAYVLAES
jgi:hypothetical protein